LALLFSNYFSCVFKKITQVFTTVNHH